MIILAILCFILPSIVIGIFILAFRLRSKQAVGTIIGQSSGRGKHGTMYSPIVEFELPDGKKITFTEPSSSNENIFDMIYDVLNHFVFKKDPNQVKVLYDPNDPQKARINSFKHLYVIPTILFFVGFCMILYTIPLFHELFQPILEFLERLA